MILLAEAVKTAETFNGLSIASWILLLTTIGGGLAWLFTWIEKRAKGAEAHAERLARIAAEAERDTVMVGVELGADPKTKAAIKKTALEREVPLDLDLSVKGATRHFEKRR